MAGKISNLKFQTIRNTAGSPKSEARNTKLETMFNLQKNKLLKQKGMNGHSIFNFP